MSTLMEYLKRAVTDGASDLFMVPGGPVSYKLDGVLTPLTEDRLMPDKSEEMVRELFELGKRDIAPFFKSGDDDFSFSVPGLARFRVNTLRQRGSLAAIIRVVAFSVPDWQQLHIPPQVMQLADLHSGMVLFTGTAGCGKSTTQACLIDQINKTRACHIITLEDPIEYLYRDQLSIITQREIAIDTSDYLSALRACLRQAPDVIQLGEMRDLETIRSSFFAEWDNKKTCCKNATRLFIMLFGFVFSVFHALPQQKLQSESSAQPQSLP